MGSGSPPELGGVELDEGSITRLSRDDDAIDRKFSIGGKDHLLPGRSS